MEVPNKHFMRAVRPSQPPPRPHTLDRVSYLENPDFPLTRAQARALLDPELPKLTLPRALVVIGGYRGPRLSISPIYRLLAPRLTNPGLIHLIASPLSNTVDGAAARAARSIRQHLHAATEIDVIGHSMGGLIGRLLLAEANLPRIRRLFTFATPHRGAVIANVAAIEPAAWQMRPGSAFLRDLNSRAANSEVELHFYARLGDWWVGARNCAPPGSESYWLDADSAISKFLGHFSITRDERVLADVLHRLTGLPPLTRAASRPPRN